MFQPKKKIFCKIVTVETIFRKFHGNWKLPKMSQFEFKKSLNIIKKY